MRARHTRGGQVSSGHVRSWQVRSRKVRSLQVRSGESGEAKQDQIKSGSGQVSLVKEGRPGLGEARVKSSEVKSSQAVVALAHSQNTKDKLRGNSAARDN